MVYGTPRPVQIIPSVLPADWANMGGECKRLEDAGVDRIQFDVMDGNFVPNLTFGPELIAACRKYTSVPFETQLMVSNYNCVRKMQSCNVFVLSLVTFVADGQERVIPREMFCL